ncbi:MAG: hypothetical protein LKE46_10740 [Clostridium sp.]|jgi:hypothetical protein|uniref:hypothetical protein n=1 Tax=Clostridium sp. TaxID=1506 RepID=UPI0025C55AC2|nr:hypothetical protein [Clostridium sp.]MCH3964740.1 hypothetical protein [Clostridium sp.]MCI1715211.1 hypothetical protein [Clostridium sp.]MCI1799473.1 hypothetical protein [Clostridium sp.]MCI1813394.1 hypothetical protein [Clostridium sp.]MCI1870285.1 hypothetical protein [Clostridium sp.]
MNYTRYDLKREKGTKTFIFMIAIILVAAFIIGTAASKLLMNSYDSKEASQSMDNTDRTISHSNTDTGKSDEKAAVDGTEVKFTAVQGGIYQDKNNAAKEKQLLLKYGTPFFVEENGKIRTFLGIYTSDNAKNIIKSLAAQKIDNSNMNFTVKKDSLCNTEIVEIISAYLQILNKFADNDVEYVKTDDLKKWCSSLKDVDRSTKNFALLDDLKKHIGGMQGNITPNNCEENYIYIYNILKKIK